MSLWALSAALAWLYQPAASSVSLESFVSGNTFHVSFLLTSTRPEVSCLLMGKACVLGLMRL